MTSLRSGKYSRKGKDVNTEPDVNVMVFATLTQTEQDNNKCTVLQSNKRLCAKKGEARILKCPPDVFEEVRNNGIVCKHHFELIKAASIRYNFGIDDQTEKYNSTKNEPLKETTDGDNIDKHSLNDRN